MPDPVGVDRYRRLRAVGADRSRVAVTEDVRLRTPGGTDVEQLDDWTRRAVTAGPADDLGR